MVTIYSCFVCHMGRSWVSFIALLSMVVCATASDTGDNALSFQVASGVPSAVGIEQICCADYFETQNTPAKSARVSPGPSTTWLLISGPLPAGLIQLKPVVDRATLFAPNAQGGWHEIETGDMISNTAKLFPSPFMALPLPDAIEEGFVYIRIVQKVPVSISAQHWSLPEFSAMQSRDQTLKLFLLGIVCAMIVYNLVVSGVVRDPAFALNAITIAALLVVALYLSGYGAAFVWSQTIGLSNLFLMSALITSTITGGLFIWLFVRNDTDPPWRGWPLLIAPAIASILPFALLVLPLWQINIMALINAVVLFLIALSYCGLRAFRGELKARIILVPLVFVMTPGVALVLLDFFFGIRFSQLGSNGMEITLCLEALLFSLALASRIRITERETRLASERVVALQNEAAIRSIAAQDEERRRLAKELHDGVGQEFLIVLGGLKQLAGTPPSGKLTARLEALIGAAGDALGNLRRISRDMHPASLEHLGFTRAIEDLAKHLQAADRLDINLSLDVADDALDADRRLHLYRILQECLANILHHAHADTCWIWVATDDYSIHLVVEDDGIGFAENNAGDAVTTPGIGLTSIDERVRACNGQWDRGSSPHGGARLDVKVPLAKRDEIVQ